jgi:hypothetical protein
MKSQKQTKKYYIYIYIYENHTYLIKLEKNRFGGVILGLNWP